MIASWLLTKVPHFSHSTMISSSALGLRFSSSARLRLCCVTVFAFVEEQVGPPADEGSAPLNEGRCVGHGPGGDKIVGSGFQRVDAPGFDRDVFESQFTGDEPEKRGAFVKGFAEGALRIGHRDGQNHTGKAGSRADIQQRVAGGQENERVDRVEDLLLDGRNRFRAGEIVDAVPLHQVLLEILQALERLFGQVDARLFDTAFQIHSRCPSFSFFVCR